ncbi:MAG: glycosyltransferase, partial [Patescibacteria group bacterium]
MKLVAILRVKDEILWIRECLSKLSELADEIIVLDNGSTDGTLEVISEFNKVVKILHTEGYHEGRDKCLLLEEAKKRTPDWIIWIDGDEVFEKHFTRAVIDSYMKSRYNKILFKLCHFWLNKEYFRIDGPLFAYTVGPQR